MSDLSIFDWECFYHIEDFTYCAARIWILLLAIYLFNIIVFGLIVVIIIHYRKKKRKEYEARCTAEYGRVMEQDGIVATSPAIVAIGQDSDAV